MGDSGAEMDAQLEAQIEELAVLARLYEAGRLKTMITRNIDSV